MEERRKAYAKVNLGLDVLGERPDGFHNIDSVMQQISLCDDLLFQEEERGKGLRLQVEGARLPLGEGNLVWKAWALLKERVEDPSLCITIKKRIPIGGGLGGGSSDAAAALLALNDYWRLGMSTEELLEAGASIGSDVPFFILGSSCRARGRGEVLEPLRPWRGHPLLLINSGQAVSTPEVYRRVAHNGSLPMEELARAIEDDRPPYAYMMNQMETLVFNDQPILQEIRQDLLETGAKAALMSGSGPTMFGLFEQEEAAERAERILQGKYSWLALAHTI